MEILIAGVGGGAFMFAMVGLYNAAFQGFFEDVKQANDGGGFIKTLQKLVLKRLGVMNRRFMWETYETKIKRKMVAAGPQVDLRPEEFMALQEVGFLFGSLLGMLILNAVDTSFIYLPLFSLLGLYYPNIWLNDQVNKRHFLITRALPYNIDLLTLSVEAGLDFTGAVGKVVEKGKTGPLRDEFAIMLQQMRMGKTREESLRGMSERVMLPNLSNFIAALIQADKMGTSLGKILRIQSTQMRIERTQRAEKLANEAPVKMLFPLIACIFPTVFLVLFGPIVFKMWQGDLD